MRGLVVALLVAVALAGCGGPGPAPKDTEARDLADDLGLAITAHTGLLLGVVVDERIVPVPDATVTLPTGQSTTTSAEGAFGFDGLEPGSHLVTATKAGFLPTTISVQVVAGERDPPIANLQLQAAPGYVAPFLEAHKVEGYILCTSNPVALCSLPNNYRPTACAAHELLCYDNVTEDRARFRLELLGNTSFLQGELVWDASSRLSEHLGWKAEPGAGCDGVGGTNQLAYGPSPLLAIGIQPALRVPGGATCSVTISVSGGSLADGACVPGLPLFGTLCPGVVAQQQFAAYVHAFYGFLPPEGWRFVRDGDVAPP